MERISDHAVNIVEAAREMHKRKLSFSKKAVEEMFVYTEAVRDILNRAMDAFVTACTCPLKSPPAFQTACRPVPLTGLHNGALQAPYPVPESDKAQCSSSDPQLFHNLLHEDIARMELQILELKGARKCPECKAACIRRRTVSGKLRFFHTI